MNDSQRRQARIHQRGPRVLMLCVVVLAVGGCSEPEDPSTATTTAADRTQQTQSASGETHSRLHLVARREGTGLNHVHCSSISEERYFPGLNGSGVAALDIDADAAMDLLFATGCPIPIAEESDRYLTRMYRHRVDWQFDEVTAAAGGQYDGFVAGVTAADFDNDGFTDIYLNCLGPNRLYRNLGDGTFERHHGSGIPEGAEFGTSSAFADLDGDSVLDLFVCNYGAWTPETNQWCGDARRGIRAYCAPTSIDPIVDTLYRGNGDGTFADVTAGSVVASRSYRSQGIVATHLNNDHLLDLYVGCDAHPNCLYLNQGDFTFTEVAQTTGAAFDRNGALQASMGIASADYDRNRSMDLFVTNYTREHNALYRGLGNGLFLDDARTTGVMAGAMTLVGWGVGFADLDADGWEDLVVVNGHTDTYDVLDGEVADYDQPTLVYRNESGRFELQKECIENEAESFGSSRGMSTLDADLDGDIDIVFSNQDAQPGVLENTTVQAHATVALTLVGTVSNRGAIGATVTVESDPPIVRVVQGGGSYLSTSSPVLLLPAGEDGRLSLSVTWPNGATQFCSDLRAGEHFVLREAAAAAETLRPFRISTPAVP